MKQFCKEVLAFLNSVYNDAYEFNIECYAIIANELTPNNAKATLTITVGPGYKIVIDDTIMRYLFNLYQSNEFIKERGQYLWQKELIDTIEGG